MQEALPRRRSLLLGLGLDTKDGHKRLTRGPDFLLAGGSDETHGKMQETVIKVNERLRGKGDKRIGDVTPQELQDLIHDILS